MYRFVPAFCAIAILVAGSAAARCDGPDELDPATLTKGEVGTLPKTTEKLKYAVTRLQLDDDVLVVVWQFDGDAWRTGSGRFLFKSADAVAKYKEGQEKGFGMEKMAIEFPGVYRVIGTKTLPNGLTVPRIVKDSGK